MKKIYKSLLLVLIMLLVISLVSCKNNNEISGSEDDEPLIKHLITDSNGNYGGTLNKELYGEGAPKNGELDVENDIYYSKNDYYNLKCSDTRTVVTNFAPYQQTMANSDGIACALMVLNYFGEDVNTNNEEKLTKEYESLNSTTIYGNGTTGEGLKKLFESKGYTASTTDYVERGTTRNKTIYKFYSWVVQNLSEGNMIMVKFQEATINRWHIIIGVDNMNSDVEGCQRDDVLIFADPYDAYDHYQDGYSISSLALFWKWWRELDEAGNEISSRDCIVISPKTKKELVKSDTDKIKSNPIVPDRHLLLNKDGSFGGTYNEEVYGSISEKNGTMTVGSTTVSYEHTDYSYYAYPDYYNLDDEGSRLLLHNYQAYEQTMASSCGPCSVLSVLNYYKYDFSNIEELIDDETFGKVETNDNGKKQEALVKIYLQGDPSCTSFNNYGGVGVANLSLVPEKLGFTPTYKRFTRDSFVSKDESMCFATFDLFKDFVIQRLAEDTPIVVCWCPLSGHFETIIGYDTMGTDNICDDVIVLADSHDVSDHYQDGYNTYPAELFFARFYNSSNTVNQAYLYFPNLKK